jgi:hypothetical protein
MYRAAAGGVALLVLLSLTGCGQLFVHHDASEKPLREQLSHVATVTDVTSSVDDLFGATVWVTVNKLVESDLQEIVADADKLLAGSDVTFKIVYPSDNLLAIVFPNQYSAQGLVDEVHYWLALSKANGAPLGILLQKGADGPYRNIWDPDETDAVNWEALRAVPDPLPPDRTWFLDGFVVADAMPTPEVVAFRDRLAAIQLGEHEKLTVDYVAPGHVQVRYKSPEAGLPDPTASASWPRVQEIMTQLAALGVPQSNFVFITDDTKKGASLHLGKCSRVDAEEPHWASAELVAALNSSGITFPVGMSIGFCGDVED